MTWTDPAIADLEGIVSNIARDNPDAARNFGERLLLEVEKLHPFPQIGRMLPEFRDPNLRELIVVPHRLIYLIDAPRATLFIIRIWHGARGIPDLTPESPQS